MGEKSESKLMFSFDGKRFPEVKPDSIEITTLYDIQDNINKYMNTLLIAQCEIEQSLLDYLQYQNKGLYLLNLIGAEPTKENIIKYRHILQKICPNNWLRYHGLPMRRRLKK